MRAFRDLSPMQLGRWIAVGYALILSPIILFLALPSRVSTLRPHMVEFWAIMGPVLLGFAIATFARGQFSSGLRKERWHQSELEPLRQTVKTRWLTYLVWLPVVCATLMLFVPGHSLYALLSLSLACTPVSTLLGLQLSIEPTEDPLVMGELDLKPLRSEHWGEGRTSSS